MLSAAKRINHVPISFDQQAQVYQGHTSCRNKENCSAEVHGSGGLELVKPARKPASICPKPCAPRKNALGFLSVRLPCWLLLEESSPWSEIRFPLGNLPVRALNYRTHAFSTSLTRRQSSCRPPSPNLVLTHPIERVTVRLRMLRRPTKRSATVPPASRVPPPPGGHHVGAWTRRTGWTSSSTKQTAAASQPVG